MDGSRISIRKLDRSRAVINTLQRSLNYHSVRRIDLCNTYHTADTYEHYGSDYPIVKEEISELEDKVYNAVRKILGTLGTLGIVEGAKGGTE